jgi:small GTP-binding protein
MELREILKKVVLLGDGAVGKTSLIARFVVNKFDDRYIATIGTKVSKKDIQVTRPDLIINLRMMIWDILGQKEYAKIRSASLTGAQGIILVGDLTRPETVRSLTEFWLKEAEGVVGKVPTILVGNKLDAVDPGSMSVTILESAGQRLGLPVILASAKTGENVETIFSTLGEALVQDIMKPSGKPRAQKPQMLAEILDYIIQDFCAQYGDLEKAMLIVQHQFTEAGVDIRKPKKDVVLKALEGLAKAEELSLSKTVATVNLEERQKMVVLAKE